MNRRVSLRPLALAGSLSLFAFGYSVIGYRVTAQPEKNLLHVEMTVPRMGYETRLQIPNWSPGAYVLRANGSTRIHDLTAADAAGQTMRFDKPNDYTWRIDHTGSGDIHVSYDVPTDFSDGCMHYSGPSTYLYVVDRKLEPCRLSLVVPTGWRVAVGLDNAKGRTNEYQAETYDVLADNPVTVGNFLEDHYTVSGKDVTIAMRGAAKANIDRGYVIRACKFVTWIEGDFFGGLPYHKYVWHFNITDRADGGGGLEHLSSTEITLSSGVGPRAVGVLAHEAFHAWNVKRIRSSVLGPFDYTQLPQTGALWWLEGVTDYYAHSLLHRYRWFDDDQFFATVASNVNLVRASPGRLEISPYDSSYRVREANNGVGNSNGLKVSYYNTGWVLGMILDLEIRSQTNGRRSLDDVERALWKQYQLTGKGFDEGYIRTLCVQIGGPALGPFYDKYVLQPGELPVEEELAKVGFRLVTKNEAFADIGATWTATKAQGGAKVITLSPISPALLTGDIIVAINGHSLDLPNPGLMAKAMNAELKTAQVGTPIKLQVKRAGQTMDLTVNPVSGTRAIPSVEAIPAANAKQIKLREGWFWGHRNPPLKIVGGY